MMITNLTKLGLCFCIVLPLTSWSQSGPGGIGTTSGGSSLQMWYESRDMDGDNIFNDNPANGATISSWNDKSGNGRNLVAPSGFGPAYNTGMAFNTVNFSSTGSNINLMSVSSPPSALRPGTMYFFYHITDVSGDGAFTFFDDPTSSIRVAQWNNMDELGFTRYSVSDYTSGIATNYNAFNISSWRRPGGTSNNVVITQNATSAATNVSSSSVGLPVLSFGKNTTNDGANSNMGEILVYNTDLNLAEQIIIENYLSAKYSGTGTPISIPDDVYKMDNNGNGNYDYEVAGIGQASDGSNHTDSRGTSIIQISSPSGLGNNEFLFWGHDNGVMQNMNTSDIPSGMQARWGRTWRFSERGDVGNVDVTFDLTGFGPVTASDLRILVDTDNDNVFSDETAVSGATSLGGNLFRFSGVSVIGNNMRMSLGTLSTSRTPLPVELISFTAKPAGSNKEQALIQWSTAAELNSSYFTVERATDGAHWEVLEQVDASKYSNSVRNYEVVDTKPSRGFMYYRLKEVSLAGDYKYSGTESVDFRPVLNAGLHVYPNPSDAQLTLEGSDDELESVRIFDLLGRQLQVPVIENTEGRIKLDLSGLAHGRYMLKTATAMQLIEKN